MLFFLDIDGVMIPAKSWISPELLNDGFPAFSAKATLTLKRLLIKDDKIILTTSHKSKFDVEEWKNIFRARGISINNISCFPANQDNLTRKEEILNWFNVNQVNEDFVIIDDDKSLNELPAHLKKNLVQTSSHIGLTDEYVDMIRLLSHRELQSS